jgi:post-segregation antitoxin (ccd killing protein)
MPRMQVYLPDDLFALVKDEGLPASELLQAAIRAEVKRRALAKAADKYTAELVRKVGAPTDKEKADARAFAERLVRKSSRKAG